MNTEATQELLRCKVTVRDGRLVTDEPIDLPEGTEGLVTFRTKSADDTVDPEDNSPEGIARWLKWLESLQPLKITPEEEAEAEAWLKKCGEYGRLKLEREAKELFE